MITSTSRMRRALAAGAACAISASTKFTDASSAGVPHDDPPIREPYGCSTQNPAEPAIVASAHIMGPGGPVGEIYLERAANYCVRAWAFVYAWARPTSGRCELHAHVYKPSAGYDTATRTFDCRSTDGGPTLWVNDVIDGRFMGQIAVGLKIHNGNETAGGHTG